MSHRSNGMKNKKFLCSLAIFFIAFSLILGITSCKKKEQEVIKIGVIGPLTGEGATYGAAMKRGIDLAIEEINKGGGINGRKLKAFYEDDKLESKEGINAFNKLAQIEKVPVIIGSAASKVTLTIAPLAENSKIILFSPISTTDKLKEAGDYIFRNVPPNSYQGKTAAQFIFYYLKKEKVCIFYKNDEYGADLTKGFKNEFTKLGGKIIYEDNYAPGQRDFKSNLAKIKSVNSEVIYFPGNYEESGIILKQAKEIGIKAVFVGGDGSYSPELIKIAGDAAEGSYYTLMALPQAKSPKVENFRKAFQEKYGEEPGVYDAYSYDALMTIAEAIKTGGYSSEGIKNALYSLTYEGVTGITKFDKYGEVDKPYAIYVVRNGKFEPLEWLPPKEK